MKSAFFLLVGLLFFAGCFYLFLGQPASPKYQASMGEVIIYTEGGQITAEVADTDEERTQGLSDRESLAADRGMLFLFDEARRHGIWMKDMNFPIDIAWLDEEKRVIWIERAVEPSTYPHIFQPDSPVKYVLEVPSGTFDRLLIDMGDIMSW